MVACCIEKTHFIKIYYTYRLQNRILSVTVDLGLLPELKVIRFIQLSG